MGTATAIPGPKIRSGKFYYGRKSHFASGVYYVCPVVNERLGDWLGTIKKTPEGWYARTSPDRERFGPFDKRMAAAEALVADRAHHPAPALTRNVRRARLSRLRHADSAV